MKTHRTFFCCVTLMLGWLSFPTDGAGQSADTVRIYLDADRTGTRASGISIEQGIRTALSEVDNKLAGRDVELVIKDHRGNTRRSKKHLEEYLKDDQALVVFSGLHSPPLLANRTFINENRILVLDPWAAAGPITRYPSATNWIFRLSVDDSKAGYVIAKYAVEKRSFKKPALLLEETGWGKSNDRTMKAALKQYGIERTTTKWFNWNLKENGARIMLREIVATGADSIFLVANAPEGKTFAKAMASLPLESRLPICSHWGITGGDFPDVINSEMRDKLDLHFIQTRFSFVGNRESGFGTKVFNRAATLFPDAIKKREDIRAPTGFIHAYDLTKILISAIEQKGLSEDIKDNRARIRDALENMQDSVQGLIKKYDKPFSRYSKDNPDAHEALSENEFVMARYGENNEIILEKASGKD